MTGAVSSPKKSAYIHDLRQRVDTMLLSLPTTTKPPRVVTVHFGPGFLGLGFCLSPHPTYPVAIQDFPVLPNGAPGAAAFYNEATTDPSLKLQPGALLTHINDTDMQHISFLETLDRIQQVGRPVQLRFVVDPLPLSKRGGSKRHSSPRASSSTHSSPPSVAFRVFNALQYGHFLTLLELQTQIDFGWRYPTDQRTLLHFAARYKDLHAAQWLLRRQVGQALVREPSLQGRLPLHDAISGGNLDICKEIHMLYPDAIHHGDAKGLRSSNLEIVQLRRSIGSSNSIVKLDRPIRSSNWVVQLRRSIGLSERGAAMTQTSHDGKTAVHFAAYNGHLESVVYLVRQGGLDPTILDASHSNGLHYAAANGHVELCQWLIFHTLVPPTRANAKGQLPQDVAFKTPALERFLRLVSAAPAPPINLSAQARPDQMLHVQWSMEPVALELRWTRIQYFQVDVARGLLGKWEPYPARLDATATHCLIPHTAPNTDFSIRVRAVNANGASANTKTFVRTGALQQQLARPPSLLNVVELRHLPAGHAALTRFYVVVTLDKAMAYQSKLGMLQEKFALDVESYRHPKIDLTHVPVSLDQPLTLTIYAVKDLVSSAIATLECSLVAGAHWLPISLDGQGEVLVVVDDVIVPDPCDIYGFCLPTTHLKRYVVAQRLSECVERYREEAWSRFFNEQRHQHNTLQGDSWQANVNFADCIGPIQAMSWRGFPSDLRTHLYYVASGAMALCTAHSSTYFTDLQCDTCPEKDLIHADVARTFADQPRMVKSQDALEHVLLAFAVHCPSIGYCQSMNYIAARLLLLLSEEQTFWVLVLLCQHKFEAYYKPNLQGMHVDSAVLEALLRARLPRLNHHCEKLQTPICILAAQWLLPLCCQTFPTTTTFRLLDCILVHDSSVVHALILAHLRLAAPTLLKTHDYMHLTTQLRQLEAGLYDVDHLLEMAAKEHHGLGDHVQLLRDAKKTVGKVEFP
ncbi:Aste57867_3050 [Aphanomyces stellatus]|uniref:Aste57867_3050 protein n=1 Tax=Aphanomyces stellatus TaxID=120398 RepID=A0A485K8X2_9STRA|nr:hypothetical protein As57867_003041 [Aphanomyces stellatus]VFT80230.1 Aste57867_3050 [Aphanomyces stellatus]